MSLIPIIISSIMIPVVVRLILGVLNRDKKQSENKVGASRGIFTAGWGFLGLTALLLVLELIFRTGVLMWACIFFSAVFAIVFIVGSYELKICYDKNGFTVRHFFRERQYRYEDIDSVLMGSGGSYTFNIKGKKLRVDNMMSGRREFFKFAKKQHFARLGFSIKEVRHKLFNGHILDPYGVLVMYLLLLAFITFCMVYVAVAQWNVEYPEELIELEPCTVSVERAVKHVAYTLSVPEGEISMFNTPTSEQVLEDIRKGKNLKMYIEPWQESSDGPITTVWKMDDEKGKLYFSEEDTFAGIKKDRLYSIIFVIAPFLIITYAWVIYSFYIMSNPARHPKIAKLLIKKDHIIW